jgi:hypothetical protein
MSAVIDALKRAVMPESTSEIAALDAIAAQKRADLKALAEKLADAAEAVHEADRERNVAAESGSLAQLEAAEEKKGAAVVAAERIGKTTATVERILNETLAKIAAKRLDIRKARLRAALADAEAAIPRADESFRAAALALGAAMTQREQVSYTINALKDGLRKLGEAMPSENFPLPHLDTALMAASPAARRDTSFGTYPWRWESIEIPVVNPDLRVPVLELDDDAEVQP